MLNGAPLAHKPASKSGVGTSLQSNYPKPASPFDRACARLANPMLNSGKGKAVVAARAVRKEHAGALSVVGDVDVSVNFLETVKNVRLPPNEIAENLSKASEFLKDWSAKLDDAANLTAKIVKFSGKDLSDNPELLKIKNLVETIKTFAEHLDRVASVISGQASLEAALRDPNLTKALSYLDASVSDQAQVQLESAGQDPQEWLTTLSEVWSNAKKVEDIAEAVRDNVKKASPIASISEIGLTEALPEKFKEVFALVSAALQVAAKGADDVLKSAEIISLLTSMAYEIINPPTVGVSADAEIDSNAPTGNDVGNCGDSVGGSVFDTAGYTAGYSVADKTGDASGKSVVEAEPNSKDTHISEALITRLKDTHLPRLSISNDFQAFSELLKDCAAKLKGAVNIASHIPVVGSQNLQIKQATSLAETLDFLGQKLCHIGSVLGGDDSLDAVFANEQVAEVLNKADGEISGFAYGKLQEAGIKPKEVLDALADLWAKAGREKSTALQIQSVADIISPILASVVGPGLVGDLIPDGLKESAAFVSAAIPVVGQGAKDVAGTAEIFILIAEVLSEIIDPPANGTSQRQLS